VKDIWQTVTCVDISTGFTEADFNSAYSNEEKIKRSGKNYGLKK
jgi:hypothetical protein